MEGGTRQRFVLVWGAPGVLLRFIFTITDAQVISGVIEKARRSVKRLSQQGERAGGVGWGGGLEEGEGKEGSEHQSGSPDTYIKAIFPLRAHGSCRRASESLISIP